MAVDLTYIVTLKDAGDKTFVMPSGFDANVEIYCWGAGGGAAGGYQGGGGGYAATSTQINAGDVVRLQVGQPGTDGAMGGAGTPGGKGGTHPSYTRYRGGDAGYGGESEYDADMGSGAGGGGATAVVVNDVPLCVGAGGGGAGGYGDDTSGSPGNPGGVYPGSATDIYPVTLSYAWCQFMNDYAVWGPFSPFTTTINFPVTGTYTFAFAVDNYGNIQVDGSEVISLSGSTSTNYSQVHYANVTVNSGNHSVRVFATNTGGPAGVAVRILKPDLSELTNSRDYTVSGGLTGTSDGGNSPNGKASGGGGGGGYYGGLAGNSYGDDSGPAPGGNGGQNYGAIIESGSGNLPGGRTSTYYPSIPPNVGYAGYPGYLVMKFTRKPGLQIKNPDGSGNWVTVNNTYVKINGPSPASKTFSTAGDSIFKVPDGVSVVNLTYLTASGLATAIVPVTPGGIIPVTVGAAGQASRFGDFSIPAVNSQVFRYIGNVDHLLNADVQIATPTGRGITSSGYNSQNTSDAASVGISYSVTYEGWHGDLYATLYFTPVATDKIFGSFNVVASGGGRAGAPSVTAQPTVANNYTLSIQFFDPYGGEGGYDGVFTLQQQGYLSINYTPLTPVDKWRDVQQIYVKNGNAWKSISQQSSITLYNYK